MKYSVYAIKSKKGSRIYVGLSQDVSQRVKDHNQYKVFSTKGYAPWDLLYTE